MSLRAFRSIPADIREWTRWIQDQDTNLKPQPVTASPTTEIDFSKGQCVTLTLSETTVVSITKPPGAGKYGELCIKIVQGSALATITWPESVKWPSGTAVVLSTSPDSIDVVSMWTVDGGVNWYATSTANYS